MANKHTLADPYGPHGKLKMCPPADVSHVMGPGSPFGNARGEPFFEIYNKNNSIK